MVQLSYNRVKSKLYRVQSFVNYMMLEIVLKARKFDNDDFELDMVLPRYRTLIKKVNSKYLLDPLKTMYEVCRRLNCVQLKMLRKAVYSNNKIEELCKGEIQPVHYSEIEQVLGDENKKFIEALKVFCNSLYNSCLRRKPFINEYDNMSTYYKSLVKRNSTCVMCGVPNTISIELDDVVSAFDHYLPRALYPFNSVNLDNLVPTCDACNQKYKRDVDPLFGTDSFFLKKNQQRCFFPFSGKAYPIVVNVKFLSSYRQNMPIEDIKVDLTCTGKQEEVDNWDRIYHIKQRYRSFIGNNEFYNIYKFTMDEALLYNMPMKKMIQLKENNMEADMYFLKVPFLKAVLVSRKS